MSLISPGDQARLRQDFAAMSRDVRLLFFTQTFGCDTCFDARRIVDELPALSDRITIEEVNLVLERDRAAKYGIDRVPAVVPVFVDEAGVEQDSRIRLLGTPAGYEFLSLVQAVLLVGGRPSTLAEASLRKVASVDRPMSIQVFTTPT
jgi:alkyl hydroperoxide reductase subunit AhpF